MLKGKKLMKLEDWLLIIGGLNWGLAIFDVNLVTLLDGVLGGTGWVTTITYAAVGLSAVHKGYMMLTK